MAFGARRVNSFLCNSVRKTRSTHTFLFLGALLEKENLKNESGIASQGGGTEHGEMSGQKERAALGSERMLYMGNRAFMSAIGKSISGHWVPSMPHRVVSGIKCGDDWRPQPDCPDSCRSLPLSFVGPAPAPSST